MKTKIKVTFEMELDTEIYHSGIDNQFYTIEGDKIVREWTPFPTGKSICTSFELFDLSFSAEKPAYTIKKKEA